MLRRSLRLFIVIFALSPWLLIGLSAGLSRAGPARAAPAVQDRTWHNHDGAQSAHQRDGVRAVHSGGWWRPGGSMSGSSAFRQYGGTSLLDIRAPVWRRAARSLSTAEPDPQLEVPLYARVLGIRTSSLDTPAVRILDGDGEVLVDVTPSRPRPVDGHWAITLGPGESFDRSVVLAPSYVIEVTLDGRTISAQVPDMRASADVREDTVSGAVPPTEAVLIQLEWDELWHGRRPASTPVLVPVDAAGRFSESFSGRIDIQRGMWGRVGMADSAGHIFVVPFAPAAATVVGPGYYALVRADPQTHPRLVVRNEAGGELFRSGPAVAFGDSLFGIALAQEGRPEQGPYDLVPGTTLVLTLDGHDVLRDRIPWLTAWIDRGAHTVVGQSPPLSRVVVLLRSSDTGEEDQPPDAAATVTADAAGRYEAAFASVAIQQSAYADVVAFPGSAFAYATVAHVPGLDVEMYGNHVAGRIAGRGSVTLLHSGADGALIAARRVRSSQVGEIEANLSTPQGEPAMLRPGDRITVVPEVGEPTRLIVPEVTAWVDVSRRVLRGVAPPGAILDAKVYAGEPDYFGGTSYQQPYTELRGAAAEDGRYELRCVAEDCLMKHGLVGATVDGNRYALRWLAATVVGVGASASEVSARATAGQQVVVRVLTPEGGWSVAGTGQIASFEARRLPSWTGRLSSVYPQSIPSGARLRTDVGATTHLVTVPGFNWQADVRFDTLRGSGPPGRYLFAIAAPSFADESRGMGVAQGTIAVDGTWSIAFDDYDLRVGDDLALYLPGSDHYIWWSDQGVQAAPPAGQAYLPHTSVGGS